MPAQVAEFDATVKVTFLVALDFGLPEVCVCFWHNEVFAVLMSVPEAAVDEDGGSVFFEDNVGGARELFHVESVPETLGKQELAHKKLWLGVLASYALHCVKVGKKSHPEYEVAGRNQILIRICFLKNLW